MLARTIAAGCALIVGLLSFSALAQTECPRDIQTEIEKSFNSKRHDFNAMGIAFPAGDPEAEMYERAARAGLITIVESSYDASIHAARPAQIRSDPTFKEYPGGFTVSAGRYSIHRIVKSDLIKRGADLYCVAHILYQAELGPAAQLLEPRKMGKERKGRVLLKGDPFSSQWRVLTGDYIDVAAPDFVTAFVNQVLSQLP